MNHNSTFTTRKTVVAALLAALTVVGSAIRVTMPLEIAGTTSFHLGNIMCALSGILLGPWLGGLAAGLGSAIYDMMNPLYISECWITFLTKGAYGLAAGFVILAGKKHWGYGKAVLAALAGALGISSLVSSPGGKILIFLPALASGLVLLDLTGKEDLRWFRNLLLRK